jgi:hypothetical protein
MKTVSSLTLSTQLKSTRAQLTVVAVRSEAGRHEDGLQPHTFGVPSPPHVVCPGQVPQCSWPPQPSETSPQVAEASAHVRGTQAQVAAELHVRPMASHRSGAQMHSWFPHARPGPQAPQSTVPPHPSSMTSHCQASQARGWHDEAHGGGHSLTGERHPVTKSRRTAVRLSCWRGILRRIVACQGSPLRIARSSAKRIRVQRSFAHGFEGSLASRGWFGQTDRIHRASACEV